MICLLMTMTAFAQEYTGTTGLLQVPSAETDTAGTFRGGISYLDKRFTPSQYKDYNTGAFTIGITAFRWLELSFSETMLKTKSNGYSNWDRHFNIKVLPLYEGRWWPAVALGMDDVGRFNRISSGTNGNNYFQNIYGVLTKHFDIGGWELGAHVAYRYYTSNANSDRRGVAGGLTLRPAFYRPLRVVIEWDGTGINAGADVLLWRHLFLQAALVHGQGFMAAINYHYTIRF